MKSWLDVIYVAASAKDARFTRICVASIRYFYPDVPIRILAGGALQWGLKEELECYWNAPLANVRQGNWGWGFVKIEALFGKHGERFLVLDSDTVFVGPVLDSLVGCKASFLVDDEQQSEAEIHRLYYNWRKVAVIDPLASPPQFVFNSGQWFGTAGVLSRSDFELLIDWSRMPPRLRCRDIFMPGDQGVLNYVLNQKAQLNGLEVECRKIMRWPGHGMDDLTVDRVAMGEAPPLVVHWAGMKSIFLHNMPGGQLLQFFEDYYYSQVPGGRIRRLIMLLRHILFHLALSTSLPLRLFMQRWLQHFTNK